MEIRFALRKFFTGEPKNLTELRDHMVNKIKRFYYTAHSKFRYIPKTKTDGMACLLISWTGQWKHKNQVKLAEAADLSQVIEGSFSVNKAAKRYDFVVDSPPSQGLQQLLKDQQFSISVWNLCEGAGVELITFNENPITRRKLVDHEWLICDWNLTAVLSQGKGFYDTPPLRTTAVVKDKDTFRVMANGLALPDSIPFQVRIYGKVAEAAKKQTGLPEFLRTDVTRIMREHTDKLVENLISLDRNGVPQDPSPHKSKTVRDIDKLIDTFTNTASEAIVKSIADNWMRHMEAHVEYRDFQIDAAVTIVKGSVGVILGVAGAAASGLSGVGAVLGFVGTLKSATELGVECYRIFRNVEGLRRELCETLVATLISYENNSKWKEAGKTIFGKIPVFGPIVQNIGARQGKAFKSIDQLKADVATYSAKVSGHLVQSTKLAQALPLVLEKSQAALKALEAPNVREAEKIDSKLKERNQHKRNLIEKTTTEQLDKIGELVVSFERGKKYTKTFQNNLVEIDKALKADKNALAHIVQTYVAPLMELPWGIDPGSLQTTLQSVGTVALELGKNLAVDLAGAGEKTEQVTAWTQTLNDTTNSIVGLIGSIQQLSK